MSTPAQVPGLLIRGTDDTLYFIPSRDLLRGYRLPDDQQRGSTEGDKAHDGLDRCKPLHGVDRALFTRNGIVAEVDASDPGRSKHKFADSMIEADSSSPEGSKHKFKGGAFGNS